MATEKTKKTTRAKTESAAASVSAGEKRKPLSLDEREWRLIQRWAKNPASKHGAELTTAVDAFVSANVMATQDAEKLSTMLHSADHGMSSIQQYLTEQPLTAFALLRLIRLERERGAGRLEKEAHKKMSSRGGAQRALNMGFAKQDDQIRAAWASGRFTSRDICAEQECGGLGISFSKARKALRNTPDPRA